MFPRGSGPFLFFVAAFGLVVLYQYMGQERQIDADAIASRDPWFEQNIQHATEPVLVKFGADWCGPCRSLDETLQTVGPRFQGRMKVLRVDVDKQFDLAQTFGVSAIPHSFILYQGRIVDSRRGSMAKDTLEAWMEQGLKEAYQTSP
ncbi:MAG: thioredoxin family protein [Planctomycetota bacterium]|jgi:thioredoxin 1